MSISIQIEAGHDDTTSNVVASGKISHIITEEERKTFGVEDQELKNAVDAYHGKKPNDAFVCSPTPWDDLYKTYGWSEVQTYMTVQSAEILDIGKESVVLKTRTLENTSDVPGEFTTGITEEVMNSSSSKWTYNNHFSFEQKFSYQVSILGTGVGGESTFKYEHEWGTETEESQAVTIGSDDAVTAYLEPGQSVVAELSANRGTMKVRIHYRAYLSGTAAVNYDPTYKGHHFYGLPMTKVMEAGGVSNVIESYEDIEIGYFSDGVIALRNPETGAVSERRFLADQIGT